VCLDATHGWYELVPLYTTIRDSVLTSVLHQGRMFHLGRSYASYADADLAPKMRYI
jgi:hypothetical protein